MTQVTVEALEAAGYRWYRDGLRGHMDGNLGLWHRSFADGRGERFSLAVRVWRRDQSACPDLPPHSFSPTAQFNTPGEPGSTVNVEMLHDRESLEQVEAFFQRAFDAMGFAHARLNETA